MSGQNRKAFPVVTDDGRADAVIYYIIYYYKHAAEKKRGLVVKVCFQRFLYTCHCFWSPVIVFGHQSLFLVTSHCFWSAARSLSRLCVRAHALQFCHGMPSSPLFRFIFVALAVGSFIVAAVHQLSHSAFECQHGPLCCRLMTTHSAAGATQSSCMACPSSCCSCCCGPAVECCI